MFSNFLIFIIIIIIIFIYIAHVSSTMLISVYKSQHFASIILYNNINMRKTLFSYVKAIRLSEITQILVQICNNMSF